MILYNYEKDLISVSAHLPSRSHHMFSCIKLPMTSTVFQQPKQNESCLHNGETTEHLQCFVCIYQCEHITVLCNQPTDLTNNIILLLTSQNTQSRDIPIAKCFQSSFCETVEKEHSCRKCKPLYDLISSEACSYQCSVLSREQPFTCKKFLIMDMLCFKQEA